VKSYLCTSVLKGRKDKTSEALQHLDRLLLSSQGQVTGREKETLGPEWQGWYSLPFVKDPQRHPMFQVYFSTGWAEALRCSVRNFLSVVFRSCPPPMLLQMYKWYRANSKGKIREECNQLRTEMKKSKEDLESCRLKLSLMRSCVSSLTSTLHHLTTSMAMVTPSKTSDAVSSRNSTKALGTKRRSQMSLFGEEDSSNSKSLFEEEPTSFEELRSMSRREKGSTVVRLAKECAQQDTFPLQLSLIPPAAVESKVVSSSKEYHLVTRLEEWLSEIRIFPALSRSKQQQVHHSLNNDSAIKESNTNSSSIDCKISFSEQQSADEETGDETSHQHNKSNAAQL